LPGQTAVDLERLSHGIQQPEEQGGEAESEGKRESGGESEPAEGGQP
jgi:hypothetical protein